MSEISCSACTDLMEYAPIFAQNGVTTEVAASLKNNTGFNPALTVLHDNCSDLNDANDCLIGRLGDEIKAYDVCDWKKFMGKFVPNLYEMLKADIASGCGAWSKIERLCSSVDGIFGIVGGSGAKAHAFTPSQFFRDHFTAWWNNGTDTPDDISQYYAPSFEAEIREGYGCEERGRMLAWRPSMDFFGIPFDNWPYGKGSSCSEISAGAVLGHIPMSAVVPHDMPETSWKSILRGTSTFHAFSAAVTNRVWVTLRGYTVIDGVVFNEDLRDEYGENTMVMTINAIDNNVSGGAIWGPVSGQVGGLNLSWI